MRGLTKRTPVKIDYAILCDQVRREDNKKHLLIGVYSGDVLVNQFPAKIALAAWIHGIAFDEGIHTLEIRYNVKSDDSPRKIPFHGVVEVHRSGENPEFNITVPPMMLELDTPGTFCLDYRVSNGRWKNILRKRISPLENSAAELEQPS